MNIDLTDFSALIVSIGTLVGVFLTLRKQRAEASESEANAADKFEQMAARVAKRMEVIECENEANRLEIRQLKDHIAEQDRIIMSLRLELKEAQAKIDDLLVENGDLKKWAEKLVKQVIALGGVPETVDKKHEK